MTLAALQIPPDSEPTALVVVFPGLAMMPETMTACIANFHGRSITIIDGAVAAFAGIPVSVRECVGQQSRHTSVQKIYSDMFGNRSGLVLPINLAITLVRRASLDPDRDQIMITGCYRGWLPGSIEVLAEALIAIQYKVCVDSTILRR